MGDFVNEYPVNKPKVVRTPRTTTKSTKFSIEKPMYDILMVNWDTIYKSSYNRYKNSNGKGKTGASGMLNSLCTIDKILGGDNCK